MIRFLKFSLFFSFLLSIISAKGQTDTIPRFFTLEQVIELAKEQSPQAIMARHTFRSSFWSYRSYRANYLPSLTLNGLPFEFNRSYEVITTDQGEDIVVERQSNSISGALEISQRIAPTGGELFINSSLERVEQLGDTTTRSFLIAPVNIGYRQPLVTFNSYKWERKIEPLKYKEAERSYLTTLERISGTAVNNFFDLALAQINKGINETNFHNNDTLYKIAQGRYNMGTIAKDELLQMELSYLTSRKQFNESDLNLRIARFQLKSFLGITEDKPIQLIIPNEIPELKIDVDTALQYAHKNHPDMISLERQEIEANRDVAQARAENLFNANLYASFGLNKYADNLNNTFSDLDNSQIMRVGVTIPILDWGVGKGKYEMAKSQRELMITNIDQQRVDFDQQVFLQVMRFNMQDEQLLIAAKSDTIAQIRYNITKQRFKVGKVDILDLNVALSEKDVARRAYISALLGYFQNYYAIRQYTLYDFENKKELKADFDSIVE